MTGAGSSCGDGTSGKGLALYILICGKWRLLSGVRWRVLVYSGSTGEVACLSGISRFFLVFAQTSDGDLSKPFVSWSEAQKLLYFWAVIKEGLRIHPALSLPLERVVPHGGLQLRDSAATFLPPGTTVGINPWVLHCDLRISGEDAESWNPGRWLDRDPDKVKHMARHLLALVAGKRTCLSKNIAML